MLGEPELVEQLVGARPVGGLDCDLADGPPGVLDSEREIFDERQLGKDSCLLEGPDQPSPGEHAGGGPWPN